MKDIRVPVMESWVTNALEDYFQSQRFVRLNPNRLTRASGACENIGTLYEVVSNHAFKWFRTPQKKEIRAYLAQTAQLALEAWVPELKKVYCAGPSFRAEEKVDSRHLTEFTMLEIEFAGDFKELMRYIENSLAYVAKHVITKLKCGYNPGLPSPIFNKDEQKEIISRLEKWITPFSAIRYDEAISMLREREKRTDASVGMPRENMIKWGDDISSGEEQILVGEFGVKPIFITHYPNPQYNHGHPIEVEKFFNMIPDPENQKYVLSCDLILPHSGETVGAAQRIADIETLEERLVNSNMFKLLINHEVRSEFYVASQSLPSLVFDELVENHIEKHLSEVKAVALDNFKWYFDNIVKHGMVKHAGCGFGISRILQSIWGISDIRKSITFPVNRETIDNSPWIYNS